jgi:hypothetical protein
MTTDGSRSRKTSTRRGKMLCILRGRLKTKLLWSKRSNDLYVRRRDDSLHSCRRGRNMKGSGLFFFLNCLA